MTLGTVTILINNPGADYRIISADNLGPVADGWGIDVNSNWLHQFLPGGAWIPVAPMPIGTAVKLVEKSFDAKMPGLYDAYLLALGTSAAGFVNVEVFDRGTMLASPIMTWNNLPRTATGITTSKAADAFVSAAAPGGATGDLLRLDLATMMFVPAPLATYATGAALDVSMAGQFLTVLEGLFPGPGAMYHFYDVGDPANILHAGDVLVDPVNTPVGVLTGWLDPNVADSIDNAYFVHANTAGSANSIWYDPLRNHCPG